MLNTYTSYKLISKDIVKSIERVEQQPTVERDTKYYLENIKNVKSIDDLMKDERLYRYAMKAHGLEDMSYAKAFMKKALKEGIQDTDSFANKLSDKRYFEFVNTFNFELLGEATTSFARAQQGTVDKYLRQTLEQDAGKQNEGVRLALYFERKASSLANFYQVLADPALAQVVRTSLGLPDSFASADIDKQVQLFESRIELDDLKKPEGLSKFLTRFTSLWEISNPTQTPQTQLSILFSQPTTIGISTDLLMTMQSLRKF